MKDLYELETVTGKPVIKGLLIDVKDVLGVNVVEFEDTLENLYKLCKCTCIDITERKVGDRFYDFVVDDEGLFNQPVIPSVFDSKRQPMLVGNALICNHDEEGNLSSLTDEQIEILKQHCCTLVFNEGERTHFLSVLVGAEYE